MKISALNYQCKQLLDSHAYNNKMVVEAAIKFGMPKEEAQHVDLMAYLRAVTIELARLKTLGVQSIGATIQSTSPSCSSKTRTPASLC